MRKLIFILLLMSLLSCKKQEVVNTKEIVVVEQQIVGRDKLKNIYSEQIGILEVGNNKGDDVFKYQKAAGVKSGMPWCGSFVFYCLKQYDSTFTIKNPAQAASYFKDEEKIIVIRGEVKKMRPQHGDLIGISYSSNKIGHVGFFDSESDKFYLTVEGNTGSKENKNDGVNRLKRIKRQVLYVSNFIDL